MDPAEAGLCEGVAEAERHPFNAIEDAANLLKRVRSIRLIVQTGLE